MSTEYIHFTAEQKKAARQTDLVALLQSQGETPQTLRQTL